MIKKILLLLIGIVTMDSNAWKNWAGNIECKAKVLTPKSIDELKSMVKKAVNEKTTIRAVGTGHSWTDIVCADGYLINTDTLNNVISIDKEKNQVKVQAGIKLKDLNRKLADAGLCLPNQAAITEQSLAGVVSTATHGSGKTGTFASFITGVQLLTADGTIKKISKTENSDLFGAVRTSIGSLGILTEMTMQCEPLFKVKSDYKTSTWDTIVKEYKQLLERYDFIQFYWNVSDDSVNIYIHDRVNDNQGEYSYEALSGSRGGIYREEEIAIPLEKFIDAANAARMLVKENYKKNSMFSGILFRFVQAEEDNLLSPAANRNVVFFSITTSAKKGYEEFYKKFYELMLQFNGRPHWGKINYLIREDVQKLYGTNFEKFIEIRKKLDPQGIFSNDFTHRIFGW